MKIDIPAFNIITEANIYDSMVMDTIPYETEAYYIFDRVYIGTKQLYAIHQKESLFVVRENER